jgi:hypothetical protein
VNGEPFDIWAPMPRSAVVFCPYGLRATPPLPPGWAPEQQTPTIAPTWRPGDPPLKAARTLLQAARPRAASTLPGGDAAPWGSAGRLA